MVVRHFKWPHVGLNNLQMSHIRKGIGPQGLDQQPASLRRCFLNSTCSQFNKCTVCPRSQLLSQKKNGICCWEVLKSDVVGVHHLKYLWMWDFTSFTAPKFLSFHAWIAHLLQNCVSILRLVIRLSPPKKYFIYTHTCPRMQIQIWAIHIWT